MALLFDSFMIYNIRIREYILNQFDGEQGRLAAFHDGGSISHPAIVARKMARLDGAGLAPWDEIVRGHLYIGKISKQIGLNPRTIRYYQTLGLLPPPLRSESRYRLYTPQTVELLRFIKKAKTLGFTLTEIREIIALRHRGDLPCPHVHALLTERVQTLSRQIKDLTLLRDELKGLATKSASLPRKAQSTLVCPHIEQAQIQPLLLPSRPRQKSS